MHVRLALAVAGALLLAGCTDDPEPTPKIPDPTQTSSTPSPTDSETPEAESPEDFIQRWIEVDRTMQNSGDIAEYKSISAKCKTCMSVAERVEQIFASGGYVKTDGLRVLWLRDQSASRGRKVFDVKVRSAPTLLKESADGEETKLPGGVVTYRMRLNAEAPWQLLQLTQLAS